MYLNNYYHHRTQQRQHRRDVLFGFGNQIKYCMRWRFGYVSRSTVMSYSALVSYNNTAYICVFCVCK